MSDQFQDMARALDELRRLIADLRAEIAVMRAALVHDERIPQGLPPPHLGSLIQVKRWKDSSPSTD